MGSEETATAIPGGPRVIDVFYGDGAPLGPNCTLFRGQISSWRPLGVGLVVGKRLCRMPRFLGAPRALEAIAKLFMVLWAALMRELVEICWKRRRMRCRRLCVYSNAPRRPQGDLFGGD